MSAELIKQYFVNILQRDPTAAESSYWTATLSSGALTSTQVRDAIASGPEATTYVDQIVRIYQAAFGRKPDVTGIDGWTDQLRADATALSKIAAGFVNSTEWKNRYGDNTVNDAVLQALYQNVLGRTGSAAEIAAWKATGQSMSQILIGFSNSAEFTAKAAPSILALKQAAAGVATSALNTVYTGTGALFDPAAGTGQTYTLTTGPDNFTGTAGNDVFNGYVDGVTATNSTLNVPDQLNGGAGTDTLNVTLATKDGVATAVPAATVSNIEVLNVRAVNGDTVGNGTASVNASQFSGLTAVNADRATQAVAITDLASGASAGMIGNGTVTNGNLSASYVNAATAATINISGGTTAGAVTVAGAGLTSTTVNSTGAANTIGALSLAATTTALTIDAATNLTTGAVANTGGGAALTSVTVKGAGAVNLSTTALEANVTKVDASANTGGLTVALGSSVTQTVTGGSGNDVVTSGSILTTGSVNAGAGNDTLVLSNVAHANTAALGAKYTNFETLRLNGTFDASLIAGISAIELSGATNAITKLSAAQAAAVTGLADIGNTTLALATDTGTSDVVSLTLGNGKGAAFDAGTLTVNGIETLNIAANGSATNADKTSTIGGFTADKLTAINLTGTAVTLTNAATTKAVTIDGSKLTGTGGATPTGLTVSGNLVNGSTVTGSAVNDTFTAGTGFATYNGGAGKDTFNATAAQLNTGADYNVFNGGDGEDTVNITGGAALNIVDNNLSKLTGVEKIIVATTGTQAQSIATGGFFDGAFKASGVDLTTTSTTGAITVDMTSFSGAATLSVTSTDGNQTISTGSAGGNDKVTSVAGKGNVTVSTGAGDDTVSVTTAGTGAGEGKITITTGAGNDTITVVNAAAGDDAVITPGAGADKVTLGTDAAKIVIGNTDSGITVASADSITGFATGTHSIALGFAGGATNYSEAAAAVADFATALTAANAALAALKVANPVVTEFANFQWDGTNGYLFNDTDGNGSADQVIVLVGITGAGIAQGDIVV
ncbi:DUF4214 domain-containing protein [Pannonibacter tanglangensis]|uniref:DUF4214 domain-containing protein n=1 Tax=Pannonibacter tanglangensis TaxID=2750084 RepID=A0ABW9ZHW0_9HYPH|nr:DUF4214 domain-containing protein [Pannonibacter sp. XCT-34]NBN63991.1 DUF4214 domain-containing protein [Pannonibacter sp. XCT-34]